MSQLQYRYNKGEKYWERRVFKCCNDCSEWGRSIMISNSFVGLRLLKSLVNTNRAVVVDYNTGEVIPLDKVDELI